MIGFGLAFIFLTYSVHFKVKESQSRSNSSTTVTATTNQMKVFDLIFAHVLLIQIVIQMYELCVLDFALLYIAFLMSERKKIVFL